MSRLVARTHPWVFSTGILACALWAALRPEAHAHGISESSRAAMAEGGLLDYVWLGAEHMVTGYDHLLFLFGVIFFLKGFRDIVRFITAFTLGHCITLLGATLMGITANAWLIDAVIALSVIYKGFENLDGFKNVLKVKVPDLLVMVFVFGLIHGFGLSTRLQELPLGDEGIVTRILAFNVGVELGQIAALSVMLAFFALWRSSKSFARFDRAANGLLCLAGGGLFVYQIAGYTGLIEDDHDHHEEGHHEEGHHGEGHHEEGHNSHDHGHGAHDHGGHDHGHEAAATPPPAHDGGHDHGHGQAEEDKAPEPAPDAHEQGHNHGHGHAEEAKPPEPTPAPDAHDQGHNHGHSHGDAKH